MIEYVNKLGEETNLCRIQIIYVDTLKKEKQNFPFLKSRLHAVTFFQRVQYGKTQKRVIL
jgi:hypothetical protein